MRNATVSVWLLATTMILLGFLFAIRQWLDRRNRADDLTELDTTYFRRTDLRRGVGSALMFVIGLLMFSAARYPVSKPEARVWGWTWIAVLVLLCALLVLSFFDWLAVWRYGRRKRSALRAEQRTFWKDLATRRQAHRQNGHPPN
jgi:UDP-N-acetylmuramyl pentapeptide phosphotransferase/UDP-N-acetylglucosamine-1-phosphate transferase